MRSLRERVLRLFNHNPVKLDHPPELTGAAELPPEAASLLNQAIQAHESSTRVIHKAVDKMGQKDESVRSALLAVIERLEQKE